MKQHFIYKTFISFLLAFLMVVPASIQAAQPKDDNTSPYFESTAVRDSFKNCKKPIWTNNWVELPADKQKEHFVKFNDDPKYGNMTFCELRNRRALTGESCTINKLIGVVGVGSWTKNMGALTDDSLDNYAQVNSVVRAGVTVDPIVSVKDMDNYYSKGTVAGFTIVAGSGSSVLSLDVIKAFSIGFYRDGKLKGVKAVREGQDGSGVTLKLLQIPGSDNICAMLTAESDWLFDEITLDCSGGIQAEVANILKIKYAFVGESTEFTITDGGIKKYNEYVDGDKQVALKEMKGWCPVLLGIPLPFPDDDIKKMTDDNLDNFATIVPLLNIGYQGGAKFMMQDDNNPQGEAFEAGMEAGFKYKMDALLSLNAGTWINVLLFDREGTVVQKETISAQVLNLSLVQIGDGTVSIKAKVPFSGCEIRFLTGLGVNAGTIGIHYGFVRKAPDVSHRCPINPTISSNVCQSQTSFTLRSNPKVSVTWKLTGAWDLEGNDILATTSVKVTSDGQVTNLEPGKYTFRATAQDGCYDETTITVGGFNDGNTTCGKPLANDSGKTIYALSTDNHASSGSLISISDLKNPQNILNKDDTSYAEYISGLNLGNNLGIIGIKRIEKDSLIYDAADRYPNEKPEDAVKRAQPKRIGFVVEATGTALNLHALEFMQIRCYHNGEEIYRHLIDENNAISADLIGSEKVQKVRYSIEVPSIDKNGKPTQMDEFQLWNTGVINVGGSVLRIYYAFIEEASDDCSSPLACSSMVMSHNHSHTTINANETKFGGAVNVATVDDNLGYLVDDDLNTYMAVANTVSVGVGQTFAVKMGRTLDYHHQLGIVIDNKTFLAAVKVGNWLTVETFKDGNSTGDKFTDWKVISAKVAGYGDKNILFLQPKKAYDEVRFTLANIVDAFDVQKFYGLVTRGDIDNDGIPDCKDDQSCVDGVKDIVVNNVCVGDKIVVHATGLTGVDYHLYFGDKNAGDNGIVSLHSTPAPKDNIQYTYTTKEPGEYQLTFFDGSWTPLSSVVYQVHPLQTRWLPSASTNEWNKWDNWSDGSPYCCTNAIISSDADNFPVLGTAVKPADYCCKDIFFEPRSAVDNVPSLNYRKAWVELEQKPNHYYLLSAPLKQMYTGDMFMPADTTKAKYFEELNEENWKEQRFNPSIYQRLWAAAYPGKIYSLDSGNPVLQNEKLGVNEATWSHNFNAVAKPYGMGEGFSMWIDNGNLPATNKFSIRLPKAHKEYSYFVDYDQEKVASETVTKDANKINRFIYEPDSPQEGDLTMEYKYQSGGKEVTEHRTVFVGQSEYQITLNSDTPTKTFLLGNPFMSRLNIKEFLEVNENVKSVKVEVENESGGMEEQTVIKNASTGNATTIAPMQAFYVTTNGEESKQITLLLTPEMIGSKKATEESKPAEAKGLKVCVESLKTRSKSAAMLVMENSETAYDVSAGSSFKNSVLVPTLLDSEVKSPLKVFGIQQSQAYDILPMTGATSLGIYLSQKDSIRIEVKPIQGVDMSGYVLHDMLSGADYSLDSPLIIADAETSLGRFVIRSRYGSTDATSVDTDQRISIVKEGSSVLVQSASGQLKSVKVIDLNGRIISRVQGNGSRCLKASIATGIQIIHIELTDGSSKDYKMIF